MASRALSPAAPREDRVHRGLRVGVDRVRSSRSRSIAKAAIDGPIQDGDKRGLVPAVRARGRARPSSRSRLTYRRRRNLAFVATDVETQLRNDFYAHLQRLEVGFHDRWQSGQLLSRASSDISVIRRFSGVRRDLPARHHRRGDRRSSSCCCSSTCRSRLLTIATAIPVLRAVPPVRTQLPRGRPSHPGPDRRPHDRDRGIRQGDPRHQGVRTRERRCSRATTRSASSCDDANSERVRDAHAASSGCSAHPEPHARRRCCSRVRWPSVSGALTIGGLVAFISYVLILVWPIEELGWILAMAEEAETAAGRVWEVFDTDPLIADRPGARTLVRADGEVRFDRRGLHLPRWRADGACAASTSRSIPARRSRSSARPAPARRRSRRCSPASTTRRPARCASTGTTCATSRCAACARRSGSRSRSRRCSRRACARTC